MSQPHRTILLVDDSPEDRELYRRYLLRQQDCSYTILEAELGQPGLALWHQHQPDVVLLDYRLPDLDGLEFLAALKPSPHAAYPVIMVTGQGNEAIAARSMKAGAQDYLVKEQITPQGLHLAVEEVIEKVRLRRELYQRVERERLVAQMTQHIHQSLELREILQTTVEDVRQFLRCDRVIISQLTPEGSGTVITESVGEGWPSILAANIYDPCFVDDYAEQYRQGRVMAKADIEDGSVNPGHVELLQQCQVRANLVVPIVQEGQLWGMIIAHHCAGPRPWQALEVDLLQQLATQVGIALQQAELYQRTQSELAERRRIEAALTQSEDRLRMAVESARLGIWNWNLSTNELTWDANCKAIFGLSPHTPTSIERFLESIHPDDRPRLEQAIEQCCQSHTNSASEIEYRTIGLEDRIERWVAARGQVYFDSTGNPQRFTGTVLDISERKQVEAQREELLRQEQANRQEAERANRLKDEFLAILSHELRSPLNPILGWVQLLKSQQLDPDRTTMALNSIERNVRVQVQLIDDLLDVARILQGKLRLKVAPVHLATAIQGAIETIREEAARNGVTLHPVLPDVGYMLGDPARLQQIVWNLLSNAVKFTPAGGRVDVRLAASDQEARITVQDTGKGISPQFLPHIFERFHQEDASITRKYGGLGLGLTIVQQLVEAQDGTITATSPGEGQGATFTVEFPLLMTMPEHSQSQTPAQPELNLTGIRVLAVDDDPDTQELLTVLLAHYGAAVKVVSSATEALSNLPGFAPDVLISDIGMPEVDGFALLHRIRSLPPEQGGQVPAIALSAYAREEDRQSALDHGYQQHIPKPIEIDKLVQAVLTLAHPAPAQSPQP
jgi:PAS domain S-box-containing protein